MSKVILIILMPFLWLECTVAQKSLMAIFAHPDDELTVAPLLTKYVREGVTVNLIIATDGRLGVNDFSGFEAGDGLAAIRRNEMQCSAAKLGVNLVHLNYHDQLKAEQGYDGHMPHAKALIKEIYSLVDSIKPDAIVTFGPDGGSNHMDHRLIGATVTSVYLSKVWNHTMNLFYVGTPSDQIDEPDQRILRGVDPGYLNVKITFQPEDLRRAISAIKCHKSQFQTDRIDSWLNDRYKHLTIYLREFEKPRQKTTSLFSRH